VSSRFNNLEEVIQDSTFPPVDLAMRRGRHIDRDDGDWYAFVSDAQNHLEHLYRRFGCELVMQSDGYFYLLPSGDQLSRRHLSPGEMLVGQTLALQYLDPTTVRTSGIVTRDQLLDRLGGLVGERDLARALDPRRRRFDDERIVHEIIRKRVAQALRRLDELGFIETLDTEHLRLRAPLLRFADPVRGLQDLGLALERLIAAGQIVDANAEQSADGVPSAALADAESDDEVPEEVDDDDAAEVDT
jgi:chromosome partition protein MukE